MSLLEAALGVQDEAPAAQQDPVSQRRSLTEAIAEESQLEKRMSVLEAALANVEEEKATDAEPDAKEVLSSFLAAKGAPPAPAAKGKGKLGKPGGKPAPPPGKGKGKATIEPFADESLHLAKARVKHL
eukprot:TRINITY_DN5630_c0_g1_i4.p1 TRINITY_DN5630_c0_g1~~TRINITY_DN5630_c0_g1_i4.p1  ORF type:complete len:128 (-),score=54.20 TRINITY_DN5630_c0_g1_i4:420-803(-)